MGTLTRGQISKKNFEVGPEVVQPGPEVVQPGPEVVQVGPLLVHSNISSTVQVSERTYSHFIEICKCAKISLFLQMAGNLKSSYRSKYVFTLPCQKSASFSGVRKDF